MNSTGKNTDESIVLQTFRSLLTLDFLNLVFILALFIITLRIIHPEYIAFYTYHDFIQFYF